MGVLKIRALPFGVCVLEPLIFGNPHRRVLLEGLRGCVRVLTMASVGATVKGGQLWRTFKLYTAPIQSL